MNEAELRNRLFADALPGEVEAGQRSWDVIRAAYATRERVPWIERHSRAVLALAVIAVLAVAAVTPPGRALVESVREQVAGQETAEPALVRLPTRGRLLVVSRSGAWVVQQDGSKRLLGHYADASWSPRGLFIVATQGRRLVALEPASGDVRWSLSRSEPLADPRWSGGGLDTRIAYRAGDELHVVAGDGSPDFVLAQGVAALAAAWRPDSHVLAYADPDGRVRVFDVDVDRELWRTPAVDGIRELTFTADGLLVVRTARDARLYRAGEPLNGRKAAVATGHVLLDALPLARGRVVYADYGPGANTTTLVLARCFGRAPCRTAGQREFFSGPGRIGELTVSPDGRWLLAAWPDADQVVFFRLPDVDKVRAVADVRREFEPGTADEQPFPRFVGWSPTFPNG